MTLTGPRTIDTNNTTDANITFTSTINGGQALTLNGGTGAILVQGAIGGTTPLTSLTATGGTVNVQAVTTTGAQSYTGTTTLNGNLTTTNSNITLSSATTVAAPITLAAGTGTITASSTLAAGANALTLTADEIDFAGGANSVTGTGALLVQPSAAGTSIGVGGGAGTLDVSDTDIAALADGFSSITIGRSDGTGLTTISSSTFKDPLIIQMPGVSGDITLNGGRSLLRRRTRRLP